MLIGERELSLEEKVGQLFMTFFHGEEANGDARRLIEEVRIGGVIYYEWSNALSSNEQVTNLSSGLQALANDQGVLPLFIGIDQEGGRVTRLKKGFTEFPGNFSLAATKEPALTRTCAEAMGRELRSSGINMNFSPVVDVNTRYENPVIGIRSFGQVPEEVSKLGALALEGFLKSRVIATAKHFPGHGDADVDSHASLPVVNKTMEELQAAELLPFKNLSGKAPAIMTGHILFPKIDPYNCATLSEKILTTLLRQNLQYRGVVISDSLFMGGFVNSCSGIAEGAIQAFNAGVDILLFGGRDFIDGKREHVHEIIGIYHAVLEAVRNGRISEDRLNKSVERILLLKQRYKVMDRSEGISISEWASHQKLAKEVAKKSTIFLKKGKLTDKAVKTLVVAPKSLKENVEKVDWSSLGDSISFHFVDDFSEDLNLTADRIIFCAYQVILQPVQAVLFQKIGKNRESIVLLLADPRDAEAFPDADLLVATHSPSRYSLEAAIDLLTLSI
ncbi:MAG: beta-N-acetylhexosaminidase [Chlamydiales bacterium]|jgi:beta-N-acetylhexosaminidase